MVRDLRFLKNRVDLAATRTGLIVQSGSAPLLAKAVDAIKERLPHLQLTVLRQRGMEPLLPLRADVSYLDNEGSKLQLLRTLRASKFDVVFVLYSNETGYWKLKLLPYFLATEGVLAVNEHLGWFPVTLQTTNEFARHVRWRLESSVTVAPGGVAPLLANIGKAVAYPATLAYLVAFEGLKNFGLRSRQGAPNWKDPARRP